MIREPLYPKLPAVNENPIKDINKSISQKNGQSSKYISNKFSSLLKNNLDKLNELQQTSDKKTQQLITGEINNIHDVMIAGMKAKTALKFAMSFRNLIISGYKELLNMR